MKTRNGMQGCGTWFWIFLIVSCILALIEEYWEIMLGLGIIISIILIICYAFVPEQFKSKVSSINKKVSQTLTSATHNNNMNLHGGNYIPGRDIPSGIYDFKVIHGNGYVKLPSGKNLYLKKGEIFSNIELPCQSQMTIPAGMIIYLYNYRELPAAIEDIPKIVQPEVIQENNLEKYDINSMDGHDFEYFCADVMRKIGFDTAEVTKGSGDHGADIIATRNDVRYAVQCKRWNSPVGNKVVQDIFYAKEIYHCHVGVIITNNTFTPAAREAAKEAGIVLWDGDFLKKHIDKCDERESEPDSKSSQESLEQNVESNTYDMEKGIYPPGNYIVGETLPFGNYILKACDGTQGAITCYKTLGDLINDCNILSYHDFDSDYFITLVESGIYISVDHANLHKICQSKD